MSADSSFRIPSALELLPLHRQIEQLVPSSLPGIELACGPDLQNARRIVALSGSFNPPHQAHIVLLKYAMREVGPASGLYLLSTRTVDKEQVSGMLLEDRVWLLCSLVADMPDASVALTNRGLYVDQARTLRDHLPALRELTFITGYDKIVQIFDPRYYADRDAALEQLFSLAQFLVAPRERNGHAELERLLQRPENTRFAGKVHPLPVPADLAFISSTAIREAAAENLESTAERQILPLVRSFIEQTGCYAPDSRYLERGAALRRAAEVLR